MSDLLSRFFKRGELSANNLAMLQAFMKRWEVDAFSALLECKIYSDGRLADLIATEFGFPYVEDIIPGDVDPMILAMVPYHTARQHSFLPWKHQADGKIACLFANPLDHAATAEARRSLGDAVEIMVGQRTEIQIALSEVYSPAQQLNGALP